jgi:hypothetical protein
MDQHQQLQQLQQLQQHQPQPQHFIPIQGDRVSSGGGVMIRQNQNKIATNGKTNPNAALGFSISGIPPPAPALTPVPTAAPALTPDLIPASTPIAAPVTSPLIGMVQDVVLGMILNVPALRTKLQSILDNPSLIYAEISKVHDELQTKLTPNELTQLNSYACQDSSRRTIGSVMQTAFANIMADGKIDMNDAPHFLTLIHDCITLFATEATNSNAVALNSNTVITFLHFVLKCILILTLDGPEEDAALVMLNGSFMLVKLTVMPLIAGKKWCCFS